MVRCRWMARECREWGDTMPWSNVPKSLWPEMERCVTALKKKGKSERSANAICYSSVVGKRLQKESDRRSKKNA